MKTFNRFLAITAICMGMAALFVGVIKPFLHQINEGRIYSPENIARFAQETKYSEENNEVVIDRIDAVGRMTPKDLKKTIALIKTDYLYTKNNMNMWFLRTASYKVIEWIITDYQAGHINSETANKEIRETFEPHPRLILYMPMALNNKYIFLSNIAKEIKSPAAKPYFDNQQSKILELWDIYGKITEEWIDRFPKPAPSRRPKLPEEKVRPMDLHDPTTNRLS